MANPVLNEKFIEQTRVLDGEPMTVNGTIQTAAVLGILLVAAAAFTWSRFTLGYTDMVNMLMWGGLIGGLISGFIVIFTKNKVLVPVYAVCEGLCVGGISAIFEKIYPGIVVQAVAATFAALFSMLILYRTGIISCSDKFRSVIFTATVSVAVVYLADIIGGFFNLHVPLLNSASPLGIGVSVVICIIAALNLIIDFDFIERGARNMLPKDYEWYGAFGLMVTIVWLYLEILRLLGKSRK